MQYLPIYPEKSRQEAILGTSDPTGYALDEHLPLANGLGKAWNEFPNFPENIYPRTMLGVAMPFAAAGDVFGGIGNTALNGYKRLYNYGANAYNNLADKYNNWQMQRHVRSPQQLEASLQTIPVEATPERVQQIVVENNTALGREQEARIIEAKDKITKALSSLVANGGLQKNAGLAKKLIDLYNKIQ